MPEPGLSLRLYRWLLNFYPVGFRESYASQMEREFRDEISELNGFPSLAGLWLRIISDLAISVPLQLAHEVAQDARHAFRLWSKRPVPIGLAFLALAIGIGANTGVFSVVNGLLLRSLPFRDPNRLISTGWFLPPHQSAKQFHDWAADSTYLGDAAIVYFGDANLGGTNEGTRIHLTQTSWNFFSLLGSSPWIGRTFARNEEIPGHGGVAVISYGLWQQLFAGSSSALGRTIRANGTPLTLIGVAPPGFDYPDRTALWTPTAFAPNFVPHGPALSELIGRLKPNITWTQASMAFDTDASRLEPPHSTAHNKKYPHHMMRLRDQLAGPVKRASLILMVGVALILLIACANLANVMLARTTDRLPELSIRAALGASRARITQQLLTESLLLSVSASAAGLLVARWTVSLASEVQPAPLAGEAYRVVDLHVLGFCAAVSLLTGLLFGTLPSLRVSANLGSRAPRSPRLIRELLVGAQVSLTIALLAASFSIGSAFVHLMNSDHGFSTRNLISISLSLEGTIHRGADRQLEYFQEALRRVRLVPGVRQASVTEFLPLGATAFLGAPFGMDGRQPEEYSMIVPVLPGYFQTMQAHILYGRDFTADELRSDANIAVVNQYFTDEFGYGSDAIGREISIGNRYKRKIIGVVRNMDYMSDDPNPGQIFIPDHSPGNYSPAIVVRVNRNPADHLAAIRDAIRSVDPQVPVFAAKTMDERLQEALARPKFYNTAVLFFAGFALLLAVIGIYGAVSYSIAQRTHELGVRMALGTTPARLQRVVLAQALITVACGATLGVVGALLTGHFIQSLIASAQPGGLVACLGFALLIAVVAAIAIWAASRRIARWEIMQILRSE